MSVYAKVKDYIFKDKRSSQDDETLILNTLQGDEESFSVLILRYEHLVKRVASRFFNSEEDILDFTQDIFIRVYEKLSTFRFQSKFSVWLYKITYNMALNRIKSNRHEEVLFLNESDLENQPNREDSNQEQLEKNEVMDTLKENIKKLPDNYRVCLELYYFEEVSIKDISAILNTNINTVKSNLRRAKVLLKDKMEAHREQIFHE